MRLQRVLAWLAAAAALSLAGCATAPRHPVLAQAEARGTLAPLVPVRRFVANIDYAGGYTLSADGQHLLWEQTVGTDTGLAVRPVAGGPVRTFATGYLPRPTGPAYAWLPDHRHVAYLKDLRGDENTQLHVLDTRGPFEPWHVTPWPGVRSYFVAAGEPGTGRFFFASNRRDRATMDLYEGDAATRSVREAARSDGRVLSWIIGHDHKLAARVRQIGAADGSGSDFEVPDGAGGWRPVRRLDGWDQFWVHRVDPSIGKAWANSNAGRDKTALVEIELATGRERVLASHPVVDLGGAFFARFHPGIIGYYVDDGRPAIRYLDAALGAEITSAGARAQAQGLVDAPRIVHPQSSSEDGRLWVLRARGDYEDAELLLDRTSGQVTRLDAPEPERKLGLAPEQPYTFKASDGRAIHGYVIRPRGVDGPVPMVVRIHGGPWVRDHWSPAGFNADQLLANRG